MESHTILNTAQNTISIVFGGALNRYDGDHFGVVRTILKLPAYEDNDVYYTNTGKKTDFNSYIKYLISPGQKLMLSLIFNTAILDILLKGMTIMAENII